MVYTKHVAFFTFTFHLNMKHKELFNTLKEYSELYEQNNKTDIISSDIKHFGLQHTYDVILIKAGYKFISLKEFYNLCVSTDIWPQELQLKQDPEIRLNVFRFTVYNGKKHSISIWNDVESKYVWYADISIENKNVDRKQYLTSINEIHKCIMAASENRYYLPIEVNINDIEETENVIEESDVINDIKDILEEDSSDDTIDSYTNEQIVVNDESLITVNE